MMKTSLAALAAVVLAGAVALPVAAADRDPHGLAQLLAERLVARRHATRALSSTDFQGTGIGCIILPRRELRPYGYPGHGMFCEVAASGEVLGAVMNPKGRKLCEIRGAYVQNDCYDFDICGRAERLCVV